MLFRSTPADELLHIDKAKFNTPFVCGARNLGEALRRISEGAKMIRTKGEAGTGNVVHAVTHMSQIMADISYVTTVRDEEVYNLAKEMGVQVDLLQYVRENAKLPVLNFSAGGIATPADAALMMQLGAQGVFVGSGIFKSNEPEKRAKAIVRATENYKDPKVLLEVSRNLGGAMVGINDDEIEVILSER